MNKKYIIIIFLLVLCYTSPLYSQLKIDVVYPKQDSTVTAKDSTFIFGSVSPVDAKLFINNKKIELYENGAFLAVVPIKEGPFSYICKAFTEFDTTTLIRNVFIPHSIKTSPKDILTIDTTYLFPKADWEIFNDDIFITAFKGSPDCQASFTIEGLAGNFPMMELKDDKIIDWGDGEIGQFVPQTDPPLRGIYVGKFYIQPWHIFENREVRFKLVNSSGDTASYAAPGKLSLLNSKGSLIGEFIKRDIIVELKTKRGSQFYFSEGSKVRVIKRRGNSYQVKLSDNKIQWINTRKIKIVENNADIRTEALSRVYFSDYKKKTRVSIPIKQKVIYKIEQARKSFMLIVTFYNVTSDSIRIDKVLQNSVIKKIRKLQIEPDIFQLKIYLKNKQQWGYNSFFENNRFVLEIKRPPQIHKWPASPLKEIAICIDPGHNPDLGAIGPTGVTEKDANYNFCVLLKEALEEKGAYVMLTHGNEDGVALLMRPILAEFFGADILLSFHFNALPDGIDPFKNRGIGNYFFHPQSERLAYILQEKLWRKTRLNDFGVFREDLILCRPTQMISVLTEPAFIMHPEEEMLIQSPEYQQKVVAAIIQALEVFLKKSK